MGQDPVGGRGARSECVHAGYGDQAQDGREQNEGGRSVCSPSRALQQGGAAQQNTKTKKLDSIVLLISQKSAAAFRGPCPNPAKPHESQQDA